MAGKEVQISSQELKDKIAAIKSRKSAQMTKLKNSKKKFDTKMNECINKVLVGDEYKKDPSYKRYERKHSGASKEEWLNSLSMPEKIDLLVEYSIDAEMNGINIYEKDLKTAQEVKDSTKEAIILEVKNIKADYLDLIKQHSEEMQELSDRITQKETEINELTIELAKINQEIKNKKGTTIDTTESAKTINDRIDKLNKELDDDPNGLKKRLAILKADTIVYESEIKNAISNLEQEFREEGIEINEEVENATQSSNNSQTPTQSNNSVNQIKSNNSQNNIDMYSGKPADVARRMMKDFKNLSPEGQKYVIKYGAYEDLLNMTKNLSSVRDSGKLKYIRNSMLNRIKDLGGKMDLTGVLYNENGELVDIDGNRINNRGEILDSRGWPIADGQGGFKKGKVSIEQKDLLNLGASEQDKYLDSIVSQINYYGDNYDEMSVSEKRRANEQMQILKMVIVAIEAKRGKLGRAIEDGSPRGLRITEIGKMLTDFSNNHATRDIAAYDKSKKLREMLHVKVNPRKSKVKNGLDASKKNVFEKKTNRGEER